MAVATVRHRTRSSSHSRRRGPVPVGAVVLSAVAAMGFWQIRAAAQQPAIGSTVAANKAGSLESRVDAADRDEESPAEEGADARRLREGTRLTNCVGHFRQVGDAVSFVDEQGRDIGGLPNLNLDRIVRMLKGVDEPEGISWSISGTITEFSGRNYMLISRAVYKASSPPPLPDRLDK